MGRRGFAWKLLILVTTTLGNFDKSRSDSLGWLSIQVLRSLRSLAVWHSKQIRLIWRPLIFRSGTAAGRLWHIEQSFMVSSSCCGQ